MLKKSIKIYKKNGSETQPQQAPKNNGYTEAEKKIVKEAGPWGTLRYRDLR